MYILENIKGIKIDNLSLHFKKLKNERKLRPKKEKIKARWKTRK